MKEKETDIQAQAISLQQKAKKEPTFRHLHPATTNTNISEELPGLALWMFMLKSLGSQGPLPLPQCQPLKLGDPRLALCMERDENQAPRMLNVWLSNEGPQMCVTGKLLAIVHSQRSLAAPSLRKG